MKKSILVLILCILATCNLTAQMPGQESLSPRDIPQFVDPLPHFAGQRVDASGGNLTISAEPVEQVAVSTGTVLTTGTVGDTTTPRAGMGRYWGYSISNGSETKPAQWPGFTIEARRGVPINVTYENNLHGETYADVNLAVDQTLHWADPMMQMGENMDEPYEGEVPIAIHLHGGEVPSESDGGPEAWFTPGYAITGPSWEIDGTDQNAVYPNTQEATTLWIHDHALGVTRLNVYAGLAAFYLLRGPDEESARLPGWSGDDLVKEVAPDGTSGTFNPQPYLPEIEIVIQDRMFDNTGALYYPNMPPNMMEHPVWTPEFIGDIITVNGKTWPFLSVAPRKYRFHMLNGSNTRFYEMQLLGAGDSGPAIIQVGTDGGLLDSPVEVSDLGGRLLLAPGERADIIIDFSQSMPGQTWTLTNSARIPYPDGTTPDPLTEGRIMQFVVNGTMVSASDTTLEGTDKSSVPQTLRSQPMVKLTDFAGEALVAPLLKRQLTLNEVMGMGGPMEGLLNNLEYFTEGDPNIPNITERPVEGTTELWQIINLTADAHPIHLHLVQFQLVGRQRFNTNTYTNAYEEAFEGGNYLPDEGPPNNYDTPNEDGALGGNPGIENYLQGPLTPAEENERGWKDTFIAYPGEVSTFITRFAPTDIPVSATNEELVFEFDPSEGPGYLWHCHILEHEDNEMMRGMTVSASPFREIVSTKSNALGGLMLKQNFPNPTLSDTEIQFSLPRATHVRLALYNQQGQMVKVLIDNLAPSGNNTVKLNRNGLASGVYYYKLQSDSSVATRKMIIQ